MLKKKSSFARIGCISVSDLVPIFEALPLSRGSASFFGPQIEGGNNESEY